MSTLLAYLQDCTFLDATPGLYLTYATRDEVADEAKDLLARLYPDTKSQSTPDNPDNPDDPEPVEIASTGPAPPKRRRAHGLQNHLKGNRDKRAERGAAKSTTPLYKIKKAMDTFEATGSRPELLQKLHDALSSVPPTSAESEG